MSLLIDGFTVDAEVSSVHSFENDVTDHPVELGADVTDHSRPRPIEVEIEGVVSDTPLSAIASERSGVTLPSADALTRLTGIRDAREPVQIATSLQTYNSMLFTSLSITKDATTGRALRFRVRFKQVIIATNERITKRVVVPSAKAKVNRGNKPTAPVAVIPPKAPAVDTTRPPVRRVPTAAGGSGFAPPGYVKVASGGSGIGTPAPDFNSIGGGFGKGRF